MGGIKGRYCEIVNQDNEVIGTAVFDFDENIRVYWTKISGAVNWIFYGMSHMFNAWESAFGMVATKIHEDDTEYIFGSVDRPAIRQVEDEIIMKQLG